MPRRTRSVALQVLLLQVLVVGVLVVTGTALATYDARQDVRTATRDRAVAVALSVAASPSVEAALDDPDPSAVLQPYAESVRLATGVDFVVVMSLDRTRYSHPTPSRIGGSFIGNLGGAPDGEVYTEEYVGTLGPSVRAVVPVVDAATGDEVLALVSVGVTLEAIQDTFFAEMRDVALAAVAVLVAGLAGASLISRRLRRQTHGLGEREITRMYEYYRAVLHAVREGLLLVDADGRVQLANDEARRLLSLPDDAVGRHVDDLGLPPALAAAVGGRSSGADDVYVTDEMVLVASSSPAFSDGRRVGAVVTLRDRTELQALTGELDVVRGLTDSLRAQTHEAANRLHVVVSLVELGRVEEAVAFATEELQVTQMLTDRVVDAAGDPVLAALLLGKSAEAAERGIQLSLTGEVAEGRSGASPRDLVTVVGNLVDNAFDAVAGSDDRRVSVHLEAWDGGLRVEVGDSGPGLTEAEAARALQRGWSTKISGADGGRGVGLALVAGTARRLGGGVTIGRSPLGGALLTAVLGRPQSPASRPAPGEAEVARR